MSLARYPPAGPLLSSARPELSLIHEPGPLPARGRIATDRPDSETRANGRATPTPPTRPPRRRSSMVSPRASLGEPAPELRAVRTVSECVLLDQPPPVLVGGPLPHRHPSCHGRTLLRDAGLRGDSCTVPEHHAVELSRVLRRLQALEKPDQDTCMWGTDSPLIDHKGSIEQIDAPGFRETSKDKPLYANAARAFGVE